MKTLTVSNLCISFVVIFYSLNLLEARLLKRSRLASCQQNKCLRGFFNCECERRRRNNARNCIPISWLCDGYKDCPDGSDEIECVCNKDEFQCSFCKTGGGCNMDKLDTLYQCIPFSLVNNSKILRKKKIKTLETYTNCPSRKDEAKRYEKLCQKKWRCNGKIDCPWLTPNDEANCTKCPKRFPNRCLCNQVGAMTCQSRGRTCYSQKQRCDRVTSCIDSSDELNCTCKSKNRFQCDCYRTNPVSCSSKRACIPMKKYNDGVLDCPDGSDENKFTKNETCGQCNITIRRLDNVSQCEYLGYPTCDNSTCYSTPSLHCKKQPCNSTQVICTSRCQQQNKTESCSRGFQCKNGDLNLASNFCNGIWNCLDGSDEIHNHPGFKCVASAGTCVLPQRNLYDDVAHCDDGSDLCFSGNASCFQCLDKRLWISKRQVCDGHFDCFDYSDECLCEIYFNDSRCSARFADCNRNSFASRRYNKTSSEPINSRTRRTIKCQTKYGETTATLCNDNPECRDFSDECLNCPNPPRFCNDSCHSFYPLGDRYCDGIEDQAWIYINDTNCPKGFDERFCENRFKCKSGNKISINNALKCNGIQNCDDGLDELNCNNDNFKPTFSSNTEMIKNPILRALFWIMSVIVVFGNLYVITTSSKHIRQVANDKTKLSQIVIILNISIADLLMGIYLLLIAIYSTIYSGYYGKVDNVWRSSLRCSVIGMLAVISSEASCFLMVLLISYRLYHFCNPFAFMQSSHKRVWLTSVMLCWVVAFLLAFVPVLERFSQYFNYGVLFSNQFTKKNVWSKLKVQQFVCRLANLSNIIIPNDSNNWETTISTINRHFPQYLPSGEFGYYGETSVCLPRFYVKKGDNAWEYTLVIMCLNFVSFLFIALGYTAIYCKSKLPGSKTNGGTIRKRNGKLQTRIARLVFTDFFCWIPICVMAFVKISGGYVSDVAYTVSAVLLLPINSAFNPILLSAYVDKFFSNLVYKSFKRNRSTRSQGNTEMAFLNNKR